MFFKLMRSFIYLFIVMQFSVFAHTFTPSNAKVDLLPNNQFSFSLETDLIELLQWQLELKGNSDELITNVRTLSKIQLYKAIKDVNIKLKEQLVFYFDEQKVHLNELYSPNVNDISVLLAQDPDNINYRVTFSGVGAYAKQAKKFSVFFPEQLGTINFQIATPSRALLSSGVKSTHFLLKQNNVSDLALGVSNSFNYIYQGIIHIIPKGLDHILFVLALFLLSVKFSSLLWQISAFTVAHTVTLALGIWGIVVVPSNIVEPIIALSIAYIAIENVFSNKLNSQRIIIVFLFGLIHGLGFASVLLKLGLPEGQLLTSLLSFNFGVELGQLTIILMAFILLGRIRNRSWYQAKVATPLSIIISLIGFYWFVERLAF